MVAMRWASAALEAAHYWVMQANDLSESFATRASQDLLKKLHSTATFSYEASGEVVRIVNRYFAKGG